MQELSRFFYRPDRWTQKALARNIKGEKVSSLDVMACSWSLLGAISVLGLSWRDVHQLVRNIKGIYPSTISDLDDISFLIQFNDNYNTSFAHILSVISIGVNHAPGQYFQGSKIT